MEDLAQGKFGTVVRAKALVRTEQGPFRFDIVYGKMNWVPFEKNIEDSRIVVIWTGFDTEGIRRTLE